MSQSLSGGRQEREGEGPGPVSKAPPSERGLVLGDVRVRFGGVIALAGASLEVAAGSVCGLIGPNGAGKTTLFDVVCGVRRPESGRVMLDGSDLGSLGPAQRCKRGLRRTFQRVQTFGWLSVEDNILAALDGRGGGGGFAADLVSFPTRRRRERQRRTLVDQSLELCGLTGVRHQNAGSLPIGTARMVEFARATVEPPRLLLLDEPASGLDESEAALLGDQIQRVRSQTDCAVLLVEHDAAFIMSHCDRVVVLALGAILAEGTPSEIRADERVQAAYLGEVPGPGREPS